MWGTFDLSHRRSDHRGTPMTWTATKDGRLHQAKNGESVVALIAVDQATPSSWKFSVVCHDKGQTGEVFEKVRELLEVTE